MDVHIDLTLTPLIPRNQRMGIERFGASGDIHEMPSFYEEAAGVKVAKVPPRD